MPFSFPRSQRLLRPLLPAILTLLGVAAVLAASVQVGATGKDESPLPFEPPAQESAAASVTAKPTSCGELMEKRESMTTREVKADNKKFEVVTSKGNCKVTVEASIAGEPLTVEGPLSCQSLQLGSEVTLAPDKSPRSVGGFGRSASIFNAWAYSQVKAKIIGADCCTIDMLWNEIHVGWWWDGYCASYMTWTKNDGVDPWWDLAYPEATAYTPSDATCRNNVSTFHNRPFHSDGFPLGLFFDVLSPDADASTETRVIGYYNGYATCSFPTRSYSYPNPAAWALYGNPLTHLKWKPNVCVWE